MYVVRLGRATGKMNVKASPKGGISRLRRDPIEGKGLTREFYEKPVKEAASHISSLVSRMDGLKIKGKAPKKYVSLNFWAF